jgi:hypothetical protein
MDVDYAVSRYDQLSIDGCADYILAKTTAYCHVCIDYYLERMTGSDCDSVRVPVRCRVQRAVDSSNLWGIQAEMRTEVCRLDQQARIGTVWVPFPNAYRETCACPENAQGGMGGNRLDHLYLCQRYRPMTRASVCR